MSDEILTNIKETLNLPAGHDAFDAEILMHINSALGTLNQIGVGPVDGFMVTSNMQVWGDFIGDDKTLNPVKTYVQMRVKLLFDPPEIGFVLTAMKEQIKELEWRLNTLVETKPLQPLIPALPLPPSNP